VRIGRARGDARSPDAALAAPLHCTVDVMADDDRDVDESVNAGRQMLDALKRARAALDAVLRDALEVRRVERSRRRAA
jgi:hypothetical protein